MSTTRITAGGFSVALPGSAQGAPTQTTPTQPAPIQPAPVPAASAPSPQRGASVLNEGQGMWIITRGEYDDIRNIGIFAGTEDQVRALVEELNESRRYVDPYDDEQAVVWKGDAYGYENTSRITAAAEVIGDPDHWWSR